jgi:type I restriction enzyme S subunit
MRAMKDSGIKWIGKIPKDWKIFQFKWLVKANDGGVWGDDPKNKNDTIVLRSTEQTVDGKWQLQDPAFRDLSNISTPEYYLLKAGDLLITKSSGSDLHIGKTTIVDDDIEKLNCCYSNFMQRVRVLDNICPKLFWYWFNSDVIRDQFRFLSNATIGIGNINASSIGNVYVTIPNYLVQIKITTFLDSKCAKIDEYLSRQQQVIEKLKEYKQSVITEAVTKGLDPDVPMKDSGVEWIGKIPEDWGIKKLKFFAKVKTGTTPSTKDSSLFDGEYCWYTPGDFKGNLYLGKSQRTVSQKAIEECFVPEYDKGSILLIAIGATTGKIGYTTQKSSSNQQITCITIDRNFSSKYFAYYMKSISNEIKNYALYTTLAIINNATLKDFYFAFPPLEQQNFIASYLDTKCAAIDAAIKRKQELIDKMTEYKKSLIYEAVTGKMEV